MDFIVEANVAHAKGVDQRHCLERGLDAARLRLAWGGKPRLLAEQAKSARIGLRQSGKQLDDGRLACAVFAEQRVYGAASDRKGSVVDCDGRPVDLADALDRYRGRPVDAGLKPLFGHRSGLWNRD